MELNELYMPTAGKAGMLTMITEYLIMVCFMCFAAAFVFFLAAKNRCHPVHHVSIIFSAVICGVASISYYFIHDYYHTMLVAWATTGEPAANLQAMVNNSFVYTGQLRYIDWTITTPLLLAKTVLVLKVDIHKVKNKLIVLLLADLFMIVTGYIGEQQIAANGVILEGPRHFWGFISTLGYILIPVLLYSIYKSHSHEANPRERTAYKFLAFATVTTWGVYPLGYLLPMVIPTASLNWVHISFSLADMVNKIGAGMVVFLVASRALKQAVSEETLKGRQTA